MKKLILVAVAILMTGMFVGCASTSTKSPNEKWYENYTQIKKKYPSEEEIYAEIYSVLEKPVITQDDLDIIWHLPFGVLTTDRGGIWNYPSSDLTIDINPDNFVPIETKRTDYTGRITNKTDKKVTFLIGNGNCGSYNQDKWYFFDVKPGETGYFVLPYAITEFRVGNRYGEHFLNFYTLPSGDMKGDWIIFNSIADSKFHTAYVSNPKDFDNDASYLPLFNEAMKNHSLEIDYYSDNKVDFKFIEPFEYSWEN